MWKLRSKFVLDVEVGGQCTMKCMITWVALPDDNPPSYIKDNISISKDKNVTSLIRIRLRKISYLTLSSKVTRRSWWYITQRVMVTHLHTTYHKSISRNKKVTSLIQKCTQKSIIWSWDQRPHEGRYYISRTICW